MESFVLPRIPLPGIADISHTCLRWGPYVAILGVSHWDNEHRKMAGRHVGAVAERVQGRRTGCSLKTVLRDDWAFDPRLSIMTSPT